jgi:short-subunit dehydrogenase involved in D-alanine esterification of teichoic acids
VPVRQDEMFVPGIARNGDSRTVAVYTCHKPSGIGLGRSNKFMQLGVALLLCCRKLSRYTRPARQR